MLLLIYNIMSILVPGIFCVLNHGTSLPIGQNNSLSRYKYYGFLVLFIPILPWIFYVQLSLTNLEISRLTDSYRRKKINIREFILKNSNLNEKAIFMDKLVSNIKVLEACLGAIPQLILLSSFVFFLDVDLFGSFGRYSYFYSIANSIVAEDNLERTFFFMVTLLMSLVCNSSFY